MAAPVVIPVRQPVVSFPVVIGGVPHRTYVFQGFAFFGMSFKGNPSGHRNEKVVVDVNAGKLNLQAPPAPTISASASLADVMNEKYAVNARWGVQVLSTDYDAAAGKIRMTLDMNLDDRDAYFHAVSYTVVVQAIELGRDPAPTPPPGVIEHPTREHFVDITIDHAEILDAKILKAFISEAIVDEMHVQDLFVDETIPPELRVIFVRPENNPAFPFAEDNDTGSGTSADPFHSLRRALREVPLVLKGKRIVIDLTGMGRIELKSMVDDFGYALPPCLGSGKFYIHDYDYHEVAGGPVVPYPVTPDELEYELAIVAVPEPTGTEIPAGTVEGDPLTDLRTVRVPGAGWVEDEFAGLFAEWGPPEWRTRVPILCNSDSTMRLAATYDPAFPISIVRPSAELHLPAGFRGLEFASTIASVSLFGIKVSAEVGATACETPLAVRNAITLQMNSCVLEGLRVDAGSTVLFQGSVLDSGKGDPFSFNAGAFIDSLQIRRLQLEGGRFTAYGSVFRNLVLDQSSNGGQVLTFRDCAFDGCTPVGHGAGIRRGHDDSGDDHGNLDFAMRACLIRRAVRSGISFFGGGISNLMYVAIEGPKENGIFARGPGLLQALDVVISGAGQSGYQLVDGAQIRIAANVNQADRSAYGTDPNAAYGINASESSQVRIEESAGLAVTRQENTTGALGDIRVGATDVTWAQLRAARRSYDADSGSRVSFVP